MDDDLNNSKLRSIASLLVAQFLLAIAGAMIGSILQIFAFELGATFLLLGLMTAVQTIMNSALAPFWGSVSDNAKTRKPFIMFSFFVGSFLTLGYIFVRNIYELLTLLILGSFIGVIGGPAWNAIISTIGGYRKRARFIGFFLSLSSLGWTIGLLFSVLILSFVGIYALFIVAFCLQLASAIIFSLCYHEERTTTRIRDVIIHSVYQLKSNWKNAMKKLRSRITHKFDAKKQALLNTNDLFIIALLIAFSSNAFFLVFSIKLYLILNRNITMYVFLNAISALLGTIAPPIYGTIADKISRKTFLAIFLFIRFTYMILLALLWDPIILAILWVLPIWPGLFVSMRGLIIDLVGEEKAASGQAIIGSAQSIGATLGSIIGGIIADLLGCYADIHHATVLLLVTPTPFLYSSIRIFKSRLPKKSF